MTENRPGGGRGGGVFAAVRHVRGVAVDLPEDTMAIVLEGSEVALAVGIVVLGEVGLLIANGPFRTLSRARLVDERRKE